MDNNIFEGAKFGDKFKTRNGELAIYAKHGYRHSLYTKKGWLECFDDGTYEGLFKNIPECDIVSRWEEQINENELTKLAYDWDGWDETTDETEWSFTREDIVNAFKAGYKKAKEE